MERTKEKGEEKKNSKRNNGTKHKENLHESIAYSQHIVNLPISVTLVILINHYFITLSKYN